MGDEAVPEVTVDCEAEWHGAHLYSSPAVVLLFKHVLRGVFEKMIQVAFQEQNTVLINDNVKVPVPRDMFNDVLTDFIETLKCEARSDLLMTEDQPLLLFTAHQF